MELEQKIARLARIGTVMDVNNTKRQVRVKFQSSDSISAWLYVLDNRPYIPDYEGEQRTEYKSGGSGYPAFENHAHTLNIQPWMPRINDTVLVLCLPERNADGFVLGRI